MAAPPPARTSRTFAESRRRRISWQPCLLLAFSVQPNHLGVAIHYPGVVMFALSMAGLGLRLVGELAVSLCADLFLLLSFRSRSSAGSLGSTQGR